MVAMVEGDSEVKALLSFPVLAMATPSGVVHLLEAVATGALIHLHFKEIVWVQYVDVRVQYAILRFCCCFLFSVRSED
uniref:Uncharacterized protein n=1 Tax=Oryza glumipatula TaxID=40148 RepID=A0A0D9Y9S7_9ORYZ